MSKLLTALIAAGFGLGLNVTMAQNVDSDKSTAQGQDQAVPDKGQSHGVKGAVKPQDCAKLSGRERDQCTQATPAGPVDVQTGQESEHKSATAKERDRAKTANQTGDAPAQSNSAVGRPDQKSPTGQGQTGTGVQKAEKQSGQANSGKTIPDQSKDTVGHPKARATTGEAQSGQEPGQTSSDSREKSNSGPAQN